jgi:hypothetical protein
MPVLSTFGAASAKGFGFTSFINILNNYSLRFNYGSSDYLNKTFASAGDRKIWTWSSWVKISNPTLNNRLFSASSDSTTANGFYFGFDSSSTFSIVNVVGNVSTTLRQTTQLFRDLSAWYHIVIVFDTTQATADNRLKLYINGSQVTAFTTTNNLSQNTDGYVNNNIPHRIANAFSTNYFSGYMSEINFIDGQALTASSFGETDTSSGIWIPKTYVGTYGTNGFYLNFLNSNSLGADFSGNGNNWTLNNLTSIDQSTDSPFNNFCTWNPLYVYGDQTFTEGNLQIGTGTSGGSIGTIAVNTGKWFWEIKSISVSTGDYRIAGIFQLLGTNTSLSGTGSVYYAQSGNKIINNTSTAYGASIATNDIIGVALDVDNRSVTYYKNGVSQGAISLTSVYNVGDYVVASMVQSGSISQTIGVNFGSPYYTSGSYKDKDGHGNFSYAVPTGYYALCTNNLNTYG